MHRQTRTNTSTKTQRHRSQKRTETWNVCMMILILTITLHLAFMLLLLLLLLFQISNQITLSGIFFISHLQDMSLTTWNMYHLLYCFIYFLLKLQTLNIIVFF